MGHIYVLHELCKIRSYEHVGTLLLVGRWALLGITVAADSTISATATPSMILVLVPVLWFVLLVLPVQLSLVLVRLMCLFP